MYPHSSSASPPEGVADLILVRRLKHSFVKPRHLRLLLIATCLAGCNAAPTPGSHIVEHTKEFAALTDWMGQRGFKPRDTAAAMEQKADPDYLAKDYQWYDGSYDGSPIFFVLIKIDHRGEIEVVEGRSGGPDYQQTVPAMEKINREIKAFYDTQR